MSDERKVEYDFEIEIPFGNITHTRTIRAESMAVIGGCLVVFSGLPILCLAPGSWVSGERLWEVEVEEVEEAAR